MSSKSDRFPVIAKTDWSSVLAVCTKCEDGESELPDRMKGYIKKQTSAGIRALRSSCLDVCPKKGVCAALIGPQGTKIAIFDTHAEPESVLTFLQS